MYRYYVSFAYSIPNGIDMGNVQVNTATPIATCDDLALHRDYITRQGYANVMILAFSLYADPTRDDDTSRRNPNPNPNRDARRNPHTPPRPSNRGRRS
ncbi:hypothetical protein AB0B39_03350 [Micromonospora sp. NPDC049114]|uniref:hypothetical protein n=1 Tax=Micromonospora sp. NPDC049114 TaxID=3155498 RepID=UPI0033E03369